ncbi:ribonuclease HII [Agromyces intestinalis]|uniref:Ribonuclease n=1 Tax=Agromyces intestinalis TaxID=2592652 RepID=A0A5C1YJI4_9MICO|nr:ribonuclease HII [Agromyces intestinalis]QEO15748.1 ribonuclease HII [Agromyces intestinalis]
MAPRNAPDLRIERAMFAEGVPFVLACDEVGRGALAGPVTVGLVVIAPDIRRMPAGLRDSKLLPEPKRELLAPRAAAWVHASAVGEASADEIDELGIMACLGLAGARAWARLADQVALESGLPLVLDGNYDWLSQSIEHRAQVITRIKADRDCASVSAASVIAKVHRDRGMRRAHDDLPLYGWDENKGYSTRGHFAALAEHGPSAMHRHTWLHDRSTAPAQEPSLFDLSVR